MKIKDLMIAHETSNAPSFKILKSLAFKLARNKNEAGAPKKI
jgi:hypothetical protein